MLKFFRQRYNLFLKSFLRRQESREEIKAFSLFQDPLHSRGDDHLGVQT